jgi:hypothetical protein
VREDVKRLFAETDVIIVDFTGKNSKEYYAAALATAGRRIGSCLLNQATT